MRKYGSLAYPPKIFYKRQSILRYTFAVRISDWLHEKETRTEEKQKAEELVTRKGVQLYNPPTNRVSCAVFEIFDIQILKCLLYYLFLQNSIDFLEFEVKVKNIIYVS